MREAMICGNCGRVTPVDIGRGFCPVTLNRISRGRPAGKCRFFINVKDGTKGQRRDYVCEEHDEGNS